MIQLDTNKCKVSELYTLTLAQMTDEQIAAAYMALTSFGIIPPVNLGYEALREQDIIDEKGKSDQPTILSHVLEKITSSRIDSGDWGK